jgi:hypothetical protein
MKVWIGGTLGQTPTVVSQSLEVAMKVTVMMHRVPGSIAEVGYPEQWACEFLDGDGHLRLFTTVDNHGVYVERFELEDETAVIE